MKRHEKPCVISCGILRKEIEHLLGKGDIDVEVHFLSERLHMDYNLLDRGLNGALKNIQSCDRKASSSSTAMSVWGLTVK